MNRTQIASAIEKVRAIGLVPRRVLLAQKDILNVATFFPGDPPLVNSTTKKGYPTLMGVQIRGAKRKETILEVTMRDNHNPDIQPRGDLEIVATCKNAGLKPVRILIGAPNQPSRWADAMRQTLKVWYKQRPPEHGIPLVFLNNKRKFSTLEIQIDDATPK